MRTENIARTELIPTKTHTRAHEHGNTEIHVERLCNICFINLSQLHVDCVTIKENFFPVAFWDLLAVKLSESLQEKKKSLPRRKTQQRQVK